MKRFFAIIADYIRETDKALLLISIVASLYGCLAVTSATAYTGTIRQPLMQLIAMTIGVGLAVVISTVDYKRFQERWLIAALVGLIPVLLTFVIGFAPEGTDDKAWLLLPGGASFQPSELLKICFVLTFSAHLTHVKKSINKPKTLAFLVLHGAFPVVLIHFQGDDGTALVFAFMFICMLFSAGLNVRYIIIAVSAAVVASPLIYFFVMNETHRNRIKNIFDLEADLHGSGYQQWMGRIALANGGITGQGLFKGELTQSNGVPKGYNDFIFVSIGEELGLLGCLAVLILLTAICVRCIKVGKLSDDDSGMYIAVGVFAMIFAQTIINVGMCISLLPVIGITLPFFSAGGSSLLCLMCGIGLVLSVYIHRNSGIIHLNN